MMSLAKPSAANRTIFARMTSRYGDVYLRALAVSSSRSILLNSMEYGLRRGIGTSRSGVCQTKRKSTLKIRHYIYEHEYLVSAPRQAEEHQEQVDEVEIERQRTDDGVAGELTIRKLERHLPQALRVVCGQSCEHDHADHRDQELQRVVVPEEADDGCENQSDQPHHTKPPHR